MNTYNVGTLVRVTCTFRNLEGVLASPTDVTADVLAPGETTPVAADVTEASTGVFHASVMAEESGVYRLRFEGTGSLVAAAEHAFTVRRSYFE